LKAHPGYKWLEVFIENQIVTRQQAMLEPMRELLGIFTHEFFKGEIAALTTVHSYSDRTVELLTNLIQEETQVKELNDEHSETDDDE
jgi:hypothetical protein